MVTFICNLKNGTHTHKQPMQNVHVKRNKGHVALVEGLMTMEEGIEILDQNEDNVEAFCVLLITAKNKSEL